MKKKLQQQQQQQQQAGPAKRNRASSGSAGKRAAGPAEEHEPTYVYGDDDPEDFVAPRAGRGLPPTLLKEDLEEARRDNEDDVSTAARNPDVMLGKDCDFFRVPVLTRDIARFSVVYELSGQRGVLTRNSDLTRGEGIQVYERGHVRSEGLLCGFYFDFSLLSAYLVKRLSCCLCRHIAL
jgi:hypothetical protein